MPTSKNIFWAFTAFTTMKTIAVFSESASEFIPSEGLQLINISPKEFFSTLSFTSSGISNLFLLHFGISALSYKTSLRLSYEFFPLLFFLLYMSLYLSGTIEPNDAMRLNQYSFGFTGALLGGIGCFNLYKIKKASGEKKLLSGFIICCIGLLLYSISDGILTNPVFGIPLGLLRLIPATAILISSLFIVELLKKEQKKRIGFI